ncbi:DUF6232 family protein [Streptomyces syringium]|uniref:DUF6232 family protein n=1 Tax=Streptomyces syringium TaxID=76729 RepID=UPI003D8E208A
MARRKVIEVRIVHQILWIGYSAYPVRNITCAMPRELVPRRAAAVGRFLLSLVILAAVVVGATAAIKNVNLPFEDRENARRILRLVTLVLVALFTLRLLRVLLMRTHYVLFIATSGSPSAVLFSTNQYELHEVVANIAKAINDPRVKYENKFFNHNDNRSFLKQFINGDQINQDGNYNRGK